MQTICYYNDFTKLLITYYKRFITLFISKWKKMKNKFGFINYSC